MPFPGSSAGTWVLQLDPSAVASGRVMLDINNPSTGIQVGGTSSGTGIDWGASAFTQMMAQEGQWGSAPSDFIVPNRTITIPLGLGMGGQGTPDANSALASLSEKVGLLQREGGWLLRQRSGGAALYADIVDAQLSDPDVWGETAHVEPGVTLTLTCLPDFYGDEVTLDSAAATGVYTGVLTSGGSQAVIAGDYPARARIIVTDTSGNTQLALPWGVRSRYYDAASTAALFYEAEALTPVNGAAVTGLAGASGGQVVSFTCPSGAQGQWITMLSTNLSAGSALTHQGTYEVWARAYSPASAPQIRLQWGVGSLSVPTANTAVLLPGSGGFYLVDLGTVTLTAPPVGSMEWFGAIQAYMVNSGATLDVDCLYLQPLGENAGRLAYQYTTPASSITASGNAGAGADNAAVGTVAWNSPSSIVGSSGNTGATITTSGTSHYLEGTAFGLAIPSGATILGIQLAIPHLVSAFSSAQDSGVYLLKAGSVVGSNHSVGASLVGNSTLVYGSSTDLWGTTWSPADINNSGFGFALSVTATLSGAHPEVEIFSDIVMTVYYRLASGFVISTDAVVYASKSMEIRWDEPVRTDPTGTVYGRVSNVLGDLARIPPSGTENRAAQVFVKPTRGDLNTFTDAGLDSFTVQVKYRPCYLSRQ